MTVFARGLCRRGETGEIQMIRIALAATMGAVALAGAAPAMVQDTSLSANFGEIRLSAGFTPDPYRRELTAGGGIDAYTETDLPGSCVGKITAAPDFEVTYDAGSLPLVFRVRSNTDTTLIVNGPDGSWACDDDSWGDGDPEVRFSKPRSGTYDIWVGTFGDAAAPATLLITETP